MVRLRDRAQSYAVKAAPYVHPKLHAVAPVPKAGAEVVEVDPLREHLEEMAQFLRLKSTKIMRVLLIAAFAVTALDENAAQSPKQDTCSKTRWTLTTAPP